MAFGGGLEPELAAPGVSFGLAGGVFPAWVPQFVSSLVSTPFLGLTQNSQPAALALVVDDNHALRVERVVFKMRMIPPNVFHLGEKKASVRLPTSELIPLGATP